MSIFIVQLGTPRKRGEGLRLGTVRRPPRGVPKTDFCTARLLRCMVSEPIAEPRTGTRSAGTQQTNEHGLHSAGKFRREIEVPDRGRELDLLAALSHQTNLSLGCYCLNESRCHRSLLRELLTDRHADLA